MRRLRKRGIPLEVSLFPFLAVLICTLGVLIVMLVVAAKQADTTAAIKQEQVDQARQTRKEELEFQLGRSKARINSISKARKKVLDRLELARNNRVYMRQELKRVARQVSEARAAFALANESLLSNDQQLKQNLKQPIDHDEIQRLTEQVRAATQALKEKREALDQQPVHQIVIAPYQGQGGTLRRPIYVECRQDALVLQPFGIQLKRDDFGLPLNAGNMLDAALLAMREYWQRHDLGDHHGQPYPLLIVYPDGAETFVLARRAMKSWDDEFGYELVEKGLKVDFGQPDPQLALEVKRAVEQARRRDLALQRQRQQQAEVHSLRLANSRASNRSRAGVVTGPGSSGPASSRTSTNAFSDDGARAVEALRQSMGGTDRAVASLASYAQGMQGEARSAAGRPDARNATGAQVTSTPSYRRSTDFSGGSPSGQSGKVAANGRAPQGGPSGDKPGNGGDGEAGMGSPFADLSLAGKRGKQWALPSRTPGSVGYVRPIRVVCGDNQWVLKASQGQQVIQFDPRQPVEATDRLVQQVWKTIDHWGTAGQGNHWKPQLRVSITQGGERSYQLLRGLLSESGIVVSGPDEASLPSRGGSQ